MSLALQERIASEDAIRGSVDHSEATGVDHLALRSLAETLHEARKSGDRRPPFTLIAECLSLLGVGTLHPHVPAASLLAARDDWLRRLRSANRSRSTLIGYRVALDDLISFLDRSGSAQRSVDEETIVAYLHDYRRRAEPAEGTADRARTR